MELNNILLLSDNTSTYNSIKSNLGSLNTCIHRIGPQNLMFTIYRLNGKILIVDLDEYRESVIETINSIQEYNYLPVIYIFSSQALDKIKELLKSEVVVHKSMIQYALPNIVKQSLIFKDRFDRTTESYNTIDCINDYTDHTLNEFISNNHSDYTIFVENLFTKVFTDNPFISNRPDIVLITTKRNDRSITEIYRLSNGVAVKDENSIILNDDDKPYFNIDIENEFFYNFNAGELSDIEDCTMILHRNILGALPKTNNISGYVTANIAMIGLNYQKQLSSFDADIIKALCVEYNLFENIRTRINDVNDAFVYTTNALARAAEANDDNTGNHIKRVNEYSKLIAEYLGLDSDFVHTIHYSAQMHDVGKIHIPKDIICKPARLTDEEFNIIKQHPIYGAKIIGNSPHLEMAKDIALHHHERYDGTGYPRGVQGEAIPLSARIVSLADIYDALRSPRSYKPGFSHEEAYDIIANGDGRVMPSHFDPNVYKAFLAMHNKMDEIFNAYK